MTQSFYQATALMEIAGTPIARVDFWSPKLGIWIYLVAQRTGRNPPGTLEVTPQDIETLRAWVDAGWPVAQAVQQLFGFTVPGQL